MTLIGNLGLFQKLKNFLRLIMLHDGPVHQCFSSSRPQEDAADLAAAVNPPSITRCDVERRSPTGDIARNRPVGHTTSGGGPPRKCFGAWDPRGRSARSAPLPATRSSALTAVTTQLWAFNQSTTSVRFS